ncbi:MAG: hypothetical protein CMH16_06325 [Methylobacterium sp.]|nr:hypothetical protein [Methylobacterium sp.]
MISSDGDSLFSFTIDILDQHIDKASRHVDQPWLELFCLCKQQPQRLSFCMVSPVARSLFVLQHGLKNLIFFE